MFKKTNLLFFFLLLTNFGFGQTKEIDSLKSALLIPKLQDTVEIGLYLELTKAYMHSSADSVNKYTKLCMQKAKYSTQYFWGRANCNRGLYHVMDGQLDSARYYLKKAINIGEILKDTALLTASYASYETTLRDITKFDEKVQLCLKVIDLVQNDKFHLGEAQYNLAVNYFNGGYEDLAIKYLKLATKSGEESNHEILLSYTLSNLAYYALDKNQINEAKQYLDKCLELCEKLKIPRVCNNYYLRVGYYYDKTEQFDKAEFAYNKALKGTKEINEVYDIMFAYVSLGEHFVTVKNPKKAIENFKKFEEMHNTNPTPDLQVTAYESWAKAEKMVGNFKASNKFLEKFISIKDSLNTENNKTAIANAETKYQSEKKDKEIAEQKLELADQELVVTQSKSKTRLMSILIASLIGASILLWFLFQQRQRRIQQQLVTIQREQEVRTLESLMEGEEKERFRIAKELHDGVNGDLSAIKFKLSSLLEMNNSVIKEAVSMIDNSCAQVRAISHNLVPPSLKDFNLVEAVEDYCQSMNSIHSPEVHFQQLGDPISLDKKQEANLFRIVQELVTNSIKHAEAKEINVQLSHLENTIQLTVEDNGKGFDPKTVKSDGIGMQNVQSRVDYLNATMDFVSNEKGTSYTIDMNTKTA